MSAVNVVFDLDGTLLDTADIIHRAYASAGVDAPDDVMFREGDDWLARQDRDACLGSPTRNLIYAVKNASYLLELWRADLHAITLPAWHVACELARARHVVHVLTGAPAGTIQVLRRRLGDAWPFVVGLDAVRTPAKMRVLASGQVARSGVYVDDQTRYVTVPTSWRFVRYDKQDVRTLTDQIFDGR